MPPKVTPFFYGTVGLNTRLDPERLQEGSRENGYLVEFAQAVNVSVDDRGLVTCRSGGDRVAAGEFHSLFCDGGPCLVVQERVSDAAIMRLNGDGTLTGIRSGLTKALPMAWGQTGLDTFYSNGTENGYIREGVSAAWPVNTNDNPDDDRQFLTEIPKANHITFRQHGQVLLAVGSSIVANDFPFLFGLFCLRSGTVASFESDVTMLATVSDGFYASDGRRTWFFRQMDGWYNYRQELVEGAPALERSVAIEAVNLADIGSEASGFGRVWVSTDGVCVGTDKGVVSNLTKQKVVYPSGYTSGACIIKDYAVIHTAQP